MYGIVPKNRKLHSPPLSSSPLRLPDLSVFSLSIGLYHSSNAVDDAFEV